MILQQKQADHARLQLRIDEMFDEEESDDKYEEFIDEYMPLKAGLYLHG